MPPECHSGPKSRRSVILGLAVLSGEQHLPFSDLAGCLAMAYGIAAATGHVTLGPRLHDAPSEHRVLAHMTMRLTQDFRLEPHIMPNHHVPDPSVAPWYQPRPP